MASRFTLPHIDIAAFSSTQAYQGSGSGGSSTARIRAEHGRRIQNELRAALVLADAMRPSDERLAPPTGVPLEILLRRGSKADILEQKTQGILAGSTKFAADDDLTIALYVPDHARPMLDLIVDDYLNGPLTPKAQQPPNRPKVEAINAVRLAKLETFWTDNPAALPQGPHDLIWWALWCRRGSVAAVEDICVRLGVRAASADRRLRFPEIEVVPVWATRSIIELMLFATDAIAELRRASDSPRFFVDDARGEQAQWVEDLAERITWPNSDAPSVCIFDTGVNRGHALIEPALAIVDMHAINRAWGVDDHHAEGHGTSMAGMALHGDLTTALSDTGQRVLAHRVESVKILPPNAFDPTEPNSYGPLTQAAIALPEIVAPNRSRTYCMAVTNENVSGATPSAWSAAIDQAAAGTMVGDDANAPKRLIVLSGGNVPAEVDFARVRPLDHYPMEDPAQAWNALTIGGYTDLVEVRESGYEGWTPAASAGELSPHSRTSAGWRDGAPFKPELVMEAGNRAISPGRTEVLTMGSLSLLSTGRDLTLAPLVSFDATSAAAAQAGRLAARLAAAHPEFWPETIRALMVHSAEWTGPMLAQLDARSGKRERYELVRRFGYGVPDFDRATASARNHLALFAQARIQPFKLDGTRKFAECQYYALPIPPAVLEELGNETIDLKIVLSYFVDPNPGLSANIDPQRYQSHGLRFDLQRRGETLSKFKEQVNAAERDSPRQAASREPDDTRWMLGARSMSAGSLHCDIWTGPAIELLGRSHLCIKPVMGWCRQRASPEICNTIRRYALIVSLKSHNVDIDLYSQVRAAVGIPVDVETPT